MPGAGRRAKSAETQCPDFLLAADATLALKVSSLEHPLLEHMAVVVDDEERKRGALPVLLELMSEVDRRPAPDAEVSP